MTDATVDWAARVVRARSVVVAAWLLAALALAPLGGRAERVLEAGARLPGSESAAVEQALRERFESPFAHSAVLVLVGAPSPASDEGRALLREVVTALGAIPGVRRTYSHLDAGESAFAPSRAGTFVIVGLEDEAPETLVPRLRSATAALGPRWPALRLLWTGEAALNVDLRRASAESVSRAEMLALPLTLGLLLLAFGTLPAAGLPLVSGGLVIVLAQGLAVALTRVMPLSITLQSVVSMLGLGLGIDYALLTVSRFREARGDGLAAHAAAAEAARHAGGTVALSGLAVAVGFLGLLVVPLPELRSVAVGGLLVSALSVAVAATLLPALLALLGARLERGRVPWPRFGSGDAFFARWSAFVWRRPLLVLLAAGLPLLALAWPVTRLRTGLPGGDWLPQGMESARALRELRLMGRVGVVQELRVLLLLPEGSQALARDGWQATRRLASALGREARVARVRSLAELAGERADDLGYVSLMPGFVKQSFVSSEADVALLALVPREDAQPAQLGALVRELRQADAARLSGLPGARLLVGGLPAFNVDYEDAVAGALPWVVGLVLGGTLLVLLSGLRSLLVPLKAVALNLLAVGAAVGALVLVFQEGHGAALMGLDGETGSVFPAIPLLAFAIVFGLSMDYEVFLISRVREARLRGHAEREALELGLRRTGGVITSAAAVMVAVFAAFAASDLLLVRMLGFTLATATVLDATLLRLALGPAALRLLGRYNWWPGRLARVGPGDGSGPSLGTAPAQAGQIVTTVPSNLVSVKPAKFST